MFRRILTSGLAIFYLLQATWLLHAGADLLLPQIRQIAAASDDSCCASACGCPEDVRARNACCCLPGSEASAAPQERRPASALEQARCRGVEAAMSQALTQPVVCSFGGPEVLVLSETLPRLPELRPDLPIPARALEKVPLA